MTPDEMAASVIDRVGVASSYRRQMVAAIADALREAYWLGRRDQADARPGEPDSCPASWWKLRRPEPAPPGAVREGEVPNG